MTGSSSRGAPKSCTRSPTPGRARFFDEIIDVGFRTTTDLLHRVEKERGPMLTPDFEGLASVVVGAIVNHRRNEWTFGRRPSPEALAAGHGTGRAAGWLKSSRLGASMPGLDVEGTPPARPATSETA